MEVDTIVAQATPPGVAAVAMIRLSGPEAADILCAVATGSSVPPARVATLTEIVDPEDRSVIDRSIVTFFEGPASYTGEDVVEISCHGGWLTPALVLDACVRAGARLAEPGEFTRRAYLRGKLDLVQAEAVADLIEARSRALHRAVVGQLERGLSRRVSELRERLVRVEALLAHHVDFPEEDDAPVPIDDVVAEADLLIDEIDRMLATAPEGELLREGALAVFAGRPNVGKSSLYNALIGQERAIVTAEAGTTRDALEASVQLGGFPFRLVDTAGLRESTEQVERLGIEIARSYARRAHVILYCYEAPDGMSAEDEAFLTSSEGVPVVLVETKADLLPQPAGAATSSEADAVGAERGEPGGPAGRGSGGSSTEITVAGRVRVSIESGAGLDQLRLLLPELAYSAVVAAGDEVPVLTRRRQARSMRVARDEIGRFRDGLIDGLPAEVAATHLRSAETALEELLGVVSVDDVLDVVFREFCVGK